MNRKGLMDFCVKGEKEDAGWEKRIVNGEEKIMGGGQGTLLG